MHPETPNKFPLSVSEVDILPVKPQNGLCAFASCVLNGQIYLGNIGVHTRPDGLGYRLVFPVKTLPNGKEIHCFHPTTRAATNLILQAIIEKFEILIGNSQRGANVSKQNGDLNDNSSRIF